MEQGSAVALEMEALLERRGSQCSSMREEAKANQALCQGSAGHARYAVHTPEVEWPHKSRELRNRKMIALMKHVRCSFPENYRNAV